MAGRFFGSFFFKETVLNGQAPANSPDVRAYKSECPVFSLVLIVAK
jgi:hypothetical protein